MSNCGTCRWWVRGHRQFNRKTGQLVWESSQQVAYTGWDSERGHAIGFIPEAERTETRPLVHGDCRASPPQPPHYDDGMVFPTTHEEDFCAHYTSVPAR